jgi:hypothetical protein
LEGTVTASGSPAVAGDARQRRQGPSSTAVLSEIRDRVPVGFLMKMLLVEFLQALKKLEVIY